MKNLICACAYNSTILTRSITSPPKRKKFTRIGDTKFEVKWYYFGTFGKKITVDEMKNWVTYSLGTSQSIVPKWLLLRIQIIIFNALNTGQVNLGDDHRSCGEISCLLHQIASRNFQVIPMVTRAAVDCIWRRYCHFTRTWEEMIEIMVVTVIRLVMVMV